MAREYRLETWIPLQLALKRKAKSHRILLDWGVGFSCPWKQITPSFQFLGLFFSAATKQWKIEIYSAWLLLGTYESSHSQFGNLLKLAIPRYCNAESSKVSMTFQYRLEGSIIGNQLKLQPHPQPTLTVNVAKSHYVLDYRYCLAACGTIWHCDPKKWFKTWIPEEPGEPKKFVAHTHT